MKDERTTSVMDASATIAEIERLERELGAMNTKTAERDAEVEKQAARLKSRSYRTSVIATVLFTLLIFVVFSAQTYAYFTDSAQSFNNSIQAGNLDITVAAAGQMASTDPIAIMPGTKVGSGVSIKNVGSLDSWIRAKIEISITDLGGNAVTMSDPNWKDKIAFNPNPEFWIKGTDGFYYYKVEVNGGATTSPLFTSVDFSTDMGNEFTNKKITITVTSDAVQSDFNGEGPLDAVWTETP
jgi:predicted ribosomally synthesized peptide with SipW-like signal peptide